MSRNSTSTGVGAWAGSTAGSKTRSSASAESNAWLGAILQTVREGSAAAVQSLLADLRADGHIVTTAEAGMVDEFQPEPDTEVDAELHLGDEDVTALEAWDEASSMQKGAISALGVDSTESGGSALIESGFEIIVERDVCRLHLPLWAGFESRTESGQRTLDELANRFNVLGRIASWLSEARKQFLLSADPWQLGCEAIKEMRSGHVSVSPQSFLEMTGIATFAKSEAFSRYTRDCFLVWPDATAPLTILFDSRARRAWVANILTQLAEERGGLTPGDLELLRTITKPREKSKMRKLLACSIDGLSFSDLLRRATLLANVGYSEVLAEFGMRIKTI